ncbi:MAG: DegV family protein [Clostridia bacterium]|nr:DegV family protein [Clostridia bacterium]
MGYRIVTDSGIDLTQKMIAELELTVGSLKFTIEGNTYEDRSDKSELPTQKFYGMLREGKTSVTTQINTEEFKDLFEPILKNGEDILYIGFSGGLSGTYQSACIAAEELREQYPERKLYTVDSLCASMGQGLLVYHAAQLKKNGTDIDVLYAWLKDNLLKLCHWFTVDDLNHLKRGGRVSAATALVGTVLGIKPVLHVDDEGHLINVAKARGRKASLDMLVQKMAESAIEPENQTIFISHGDCYDDAKYVADKVREKFGTKKFEINFVGPVIGGHAGPGVVALFFLGTQR